MTLVPPSLLLGNLIGITTFTMKGSQRRHAALPLVEVRSVEPKTVASPSRLHVSQHLDRATIPATASRFKVATVRGILQ